MPQIFWLFYRELPSGYSAQIFLLFSRCESSCHIIELVDFLFLAASRFERFTPGNIKSDPFTGPVWPRGWVEGYDRGTRRGEWLAARPGRTLPPGKSRYPLYRRLDGPQGRSGWVENLVPTGIRSRTVQPIAQSIYRLSYSGEYTA